MKSILLKALLFINLFFIYNCKAQTTSDYITFYNDVVPKLNSIVPNKTQFYGHNFSNFNTKLKNKNVEIVRWFQDTKISPSTKYYVLKLFFFDRSLLSVASDNDFNFPRVIITFENEIPSQVQNLMVESRGDWTYNVQQFFANLKIEKIEFTGVKGYDSHDYSE
ncbi:hypothetical protein GCM10023210_33020 [Chryseobacterium ginsengisoli]|uniref:DUF4468 domain-containing protein n=1 Tax=Chryseobacterium ginsengisoli TaxID=363853 RepID=A0ABP9MMB0_9FLAO